MAIAAVWLFFSIDREVDYDEANYLTIAKSIARTGLPYLTGIEDLGRQEVFITSPPLVMALAAATQSVWPGETFPSRLVQVLVFSLPVYLLVWHVARRQYGPWPACFAVAALLSSAQFLGHATVVRLDVPLALFSLLSLWCFYRSVEAGPAGWRWPALAALCLAAAVLAKLQAVCIPAGIGLYLGWLLLKRDFATLRRCVRPLALQACAGALALAALYAYLVVLPGPGAAQYGGGVSHTTSQMDTAGQGPREVLAYYAALPLKSMIYLGWPLAAAVLGLLPGNARSGFSSLLVCFCLAVALFNIGVAKLCGAGTYYLIVIFPPLAILAGRGAAVALENAFPRRGFVLAALIAVLLGWQFVQDRPWRVPFGIPAGSRAARVAERLRLLDPGNDGVMAEDTAIQFFSDRPTGTLQYTPYPVVEDYLAGRGPYPVSFVVLRNSSITRPDAYLAKHWESTRKLLRAHFEPVPSGVEGVTLLVRKGKPLVSPTSSTARCTTGP